ncbi:MAG: hypothetical protein ABJY83_17220 [Roseibium sp.]
MGRCLRKNGLPLLIGPWAVRLWCISLTFDTFYAKSWIVFNKATLLAPSEHDGKHLFHIGAKSSTLVFMGLVTQEHDKRGRKAGEGRVAQRLQIAQNHLVVAPCSRSQIKERPATTIFLDQKPKGARFCSLMFAGVIKSGAFAVKGG